MRRLPDRSSSQGNNMSRSILTACSEPFRTRHDYHKCMAASHRLAYVQTCSSAHSPFLSGGAMQALTRLNAPKVHTEWRQRMRNAKLMELQAEAERMQARHAHAMHIRNLALQVTKFLLVQYSILLPYMMFMARKLAFRAS